MTLSSVDLKNNGGATAVKRPTKNCDKLPQNESPEPVCTANSNNEEIKKNNGQKSSQHIQLTIYPSAI